MYKETHTMRSFTVYDDVRAIKSRRFVGGGRQSIHRSNYNFIQNFGLKISLKGPLVHGIVRAIILKWILEKWVVRL
jgi:hypothetical protein